MKKYLILTTGALLLALAVGVLVLSGRSTPVSATPLAESTPQPTPRTLSITGQASVMAEPDVAYITVGVHTQAPKAADALSANNTRVAEVYRTLADFGIEKKDIRTTNLALYQREERDKDGKVTARYYIAENVVQITVRDISQVGRVLDAVVQNGANRLQGIRFDVSDRAALLEQARLEAVKQGKAQAQAVAEAAGARLSEVQSISFQTVAQPVAREAVMMAAAPKGANEVPVSGGQMQITATVHMVFALQSP